MDEKGVFPPNVGAHLAQGFDERQRLNVAHRAADFHNHDFRAGGLRHLANAALDFVGNVGNNLDRAAEVVAAAFLGNHFGIDLAGGDIAVTVEADIHEAFIVAEVEVGFRAVVQHIHLAVLVRAHGARVDVDVRVEFLRRNGKAALFEGTA